MPSVPSRHAFRPLRIGGLQAMTTLDYPDHLACVLFCQGCAWRCRYCHNPELIRCGGPTEWSWNKVLGFLRQRQGLLQAVVFSGGEATLQPALPSAMRRVRELGFKVGLHSAGIKPASFGRALHNLENFHVIYGIIQVIGPADFGQICADHDINIKSLSQCLLFRLIAMITEKCHIFEFNIIHHSHPAIVNFPD